MSVWLSGLNETTMTLITLCVILFSGFLVTRLTKRIKLPNVSGYILAGILIGPSVLNMVPEQMLSRMNFVSDFALALIAFGVGRFFLKSSLKDMGRAVIVITLIESLLAGVLVALTMKFLFHMETGLSLLLGAIATATAPASTMMTIRQYHARGQFVNLLLGIVALDDVVCLFAFSVATVAVIGSGNESVDLSGVIMPIVWNIAAILLGLGCGFILSRLLAVPTRSEDNRLILAVAMLLGISGGCALVNVSPLLSCMVFGATYINLTQDKRLYHQIESFSPPIMSMFFIIAGMNLDIGVLSSFGIAGVAYFIVRIAGKYLGAWLGCSLTKTNGNTRSLLGLALIPQAGVAIGLAFLAQRMLPTREGGILMTLILASSVLYEFIGPVCAKFALLHSSETTLRKGDEHEVQASADPQRTVNAGGAGHLAEKTH